MSVRREARGAALIVALVLLGGLAGGGLPGGALAQAPAGCTVGAAAGPPREVIRCGSRLTITVEGGSRYRLVGAEAPGGPTGAVLESGAMLVKSPAGAARPFQIQTPHAIASVRGTEWAVDVGGSRTSVFVRRGRVAVGRASGGPGPVLRAGEGVDVEGTAPLEVKRWGEPRIRALLARLGE